MDYKTNWKDFLKYDEHGRRAHDFPCYVVDTAPGEKNYMYRGEYEAMIAAENAVRLAHRAARQAELAASRPNSVNSAVTPGSEASGSPASLPPASLHRVPDLERHSRKCLVCSHPDRDAIEGEFIRWRSPHKIARDYNLTDRASIYRHAHATNLFEERRRHIGRVLESFLETIDDNPPADFDPVTRAVRVYAHLNANGAWFEPLRKVHITTSHAPWPHPNLDPDDPVGNDGTHELELEHQISVVPEGRHNISPARSAAECREQQRREPPTSVEHSPRSNRSDAFSPASSGVPAGTAEGSPGLESGENERREPLTSGAASSAALHAGASKDASHSSLPTESLAATKEFGCADNSSSRHSPLVTSHCRQSNRNNPKIQNLHGQHQTNHIPKLNRNKNAVSASPGFRRAQ
jgi:hypothetical protein